MRSDIIKKGYQKAPHRSLLRATGLQDADFDKPFIGVANSYIDIIPGHFFLNKYAAIIKEEIRAAVFAYAEECKRHGLQVMENIAQQMRQKEQQQDFRNRYSY